MTYYCKPLINETFYGISLSEVVMGWDVPEERECLVFEVQCSSAVTFELVFFWDLGI